MSNKSDRKAKLLLETAAVSLAAALACALSSEATAGRATAEPSVGAQELSARVAAIVESVRVGEPTLLRGLSPETKIAQWRNR